MQRRVNACGKLNRNGEQPQMTRRQGRVDMDKPRFTLQLTLRDNFGYDTLHMAVDLDREVRISARAVDVMKAGVSTFDEAITMMQTKELRKKLFHETAGRLGALMAERMEDAEGWHDVERIEPARKQLGGTWR